MKELPIILDAFSGLMAKIRRTFSQLSLEGRPQEQRLFLLTYACFYSNFSASLTVLRSGDYSSLPLVLRPALEAYADIINIKKDIVYAGRLMYSLDKKRLAYLKSICSIGRNTIATNNEMRNLEVTLEKYPNEQRRMLTVKEKFLTADLHGYHVAVYGMMSGFVHNDFYFTTSKEFNICGNFFDVLSSNCRVKDIMIANVLLMCEILMNSTIALAAHITGYDEVMYSSFCTCAHELNEYLMNIYNSTQQQL